MKKKLALLLAATMAASMIGCGSSDATSAADASADTQDSADQSAAESTDAAASATTGDKIPITLWHIQTGTVADIIQESADRFMADNPQYEVTVVQKQNDSYKTDLSLAINAGTVPDVFITWGGQTMYDYVDA